ncbi:MAG: chorismate-binding protein [Myxococcota bacterium]|nr:chorismate-binding protein [Myxococcota bacterium]
MTLEQLHALPSFALLAPAYSGGEHWTLITGLSPDPQGPLLFLPFEGSIREARRFSGSPRSSPAPRFEPGPALAVELNGSGYTAAVERIREAIAQGDVYQVCLTLRAQVAGATGAQLLSTLCTPAAPRFAAWVRLPDGTEFVSASPELLLQRSGDRVTTEPMKGTARPGAQGKLESSEKDRAELAMITDLVRNDLTPVCQPGSIRVVEPRRLVTLPYALQMVSVVEGRLEEGRTELDALEALHPGGSVTGAPKQAARRMIAALEPTPRGAYCGVLGWRATPKAATYALLIRTAERRGEAWTYGVGSGVVYDSGPAAEWEELRIKLRALGDQPVLVGPENPRSR